jgi:hypothetical protein
MGENGELFDETGAPASPVDPATAMAALTEAARRLDVEIRIRPLDDDDHRIGSGACVVKGRGLVIVDRRLSLPRRVTAVAAALNEFEPDRVYLPPLARQLLARSRPEHEEESP